MKTNVKESTVIAVPYKDKKKILSRILDLQKWGGWSPWLCMDPAAKISFSQEDNKQFRHMHWEGRFTGEGTTTITRVREDGADFDLQFLKPFKSRAEGGLTLSPENGGKAVRVEWTMIGNLPFFMFFMKKLFETMIARDYQRGLKRLRHLVENGKVPARLEFTDTPQEAEGFEFCGLDYHLIHRSELGGVMEEGFTRIEALLANPEKGGILKKTGGYCFYPKVRFLKNLFDFTVGHSFTGKRESLSTSGLTLKTIPPHRVIKVTLTGKYDFLDDAWTGIMMHARGLKLKPLKSIPPYEKYVKMGKNPDAYVTEVCYPIK